MPDGRAKKTRTPTKTKKVQSETPKKTKKAKHDTPKRPSRMKDDAEDVVVDPYERAKPARKSRMKDVMSTPSNSESSSDGLCLATWKNKPPGSGEPDEALRRYACVNLKSC